MRVLHVNKFLYRRGGAEAYMLDLAAAQRARGDQVEFFAMRHPDNLPAAHESAFPATVDFTSANLGAKAAAAARMLWSASARRGVGRVLGAHRPDVVHLHNIYHQLSPSILGAIAGAGVPMVLTMHDYKLVCPSYQLTDHGQPCEACLGGSLLEPLKRRCKDGSITASAAVTLETALHRATRAYDPIDVLIAPSAYLASRMAAGGVDRARIEVCPLFAPPGAGAEPGAGIGSRRLAFVGRLEPEKGLDVLIRALAVLPDLRLDVAGEGSAAGDLRELAERLAPARVTFLGRLDSTGVRTLLAGAQALALPSRWPENQPVTMLEALAAGTPVVASAVGGIPELIDDGRTGLLVPPEDWRALAASLSRLDKDPALARKVAAAGARRAGDLSVDRHLAQLDGIYSRAAERAPSDRAQPLAPRFPRRQRTSS